MYEATISTYFSVPPVEGAFRFRVVGDSTTGSSSIPSRLADTIRLLEGPAHVTRRILINISTKIESKKSTKSKHSDAHLGLFVLRAQLQEEEVYFDNVRD